MKCALCGNEKTFKNVAKKDAKTSKQLLVSMCEDCGLVQQNYIPSTDELKTYYSHNYRKDYKNIYTPKPKHIYRAGKLALQRINFLKKIVSQSGTLLDVGAGGGEFVYLSKKLGFVSQGIEPSIGYSEYAKNEYKCTVKTGELNSIKGTYDIITMFHVLEHLPSPTATFKKLHSLLNDKGRLLIEVPWIESIDASPHNIYFKAHLFYFSIDTLISSASQYFSVVKVDTLSSLKIVFEVKKESPLMLPNINSVTDIKNKLNEKGWLEYIFKGKGYAKPINKIMMTIDESKANGVAPITILDNLVAKNW